MKLLHIDSSILGPASVSRELTSATVEHFRSLVSTPDVIYRDLASEPLGHFGIPDMPSYDGHLAFAAAEAPQIENRAATSKQLLEEFLSADLVVIGAPMYNFTVPTQLKSWLDRIMVPGRTFGYTAEGPIGLARGKRVVAICSCGGYFEPGSPKAAFEMTASLVRNAFSLMGIELEAIIADGTQMGPEHRERAIAKAKVAISQLRK